MKFILLKADTDAEVEVEVIQAKDDAAAILKQVKELLGIWGESQPFVMGSRVKEDDWKWYYENIFNESRLYEALGKDHARSVLSIFRTFKSVVDFAVGMESTS